MKVEISHNRIGEITHLEVISQWLGRRGLIRVIRRVSGVEIIWTPRWLFPGLFLEDVFCEFSMGEHRFTVACLWGDGSTFDIYADHPGRSSDQMEALAQHLMAQK